MTTTPKRTEAAERANIPKRTEAAERANIPKRTLRATELAAERANIPWASAFTMLLNALEASIDNPKGGLGAFWVEVFATVDAKTESRQKSKREYDQRVRTENKLAQIPSEGLETSSIKSGYADVYESGPNGWHARVKMDDGGWKFLKTRRSPKEAARDRKVWSEKHAPEMLVPANLRQSYTNWRETHPNSTHEEALLEATWDNRCTQPRSEEEHAAMVRVANTMKNRDYSRAEERALWEMVEKELQADKLVQEPQGSVLVVTPSKETKDSKKSKKADEPKGIFDDVPSGSEAEMMAMNKNLQPKVVALPLEGEPLPHGVQRNYNYYRTALPEASHEEALEYAYGVIDGTRPRKIEGATQTKPSP